MPKNELIADSLLDFEFIRGADRLFALRSYGVLGQPPEKVFEELTKLAAQVCQAPVSVITLVDSDRQWFVSSYGAEMSQAPLKDGFCPIAISRAKNNPAPLIVPDALADTDFETHPAIKNMGLRSYAGVPLVTSGGHIIGTLCVVDFKPRQLQPSQIEGLQTLSHQVMGQLELRLAAQQVAQTNQLLTAVSCSLAAKVGDTFFSSLVQRFTEALEVNFAYIALVDPQVPDHLQTLTVCYQGKMLDNYRYALANTPCEEILQQQAFCLYQRDVQASFPEASRLASMQIESYAAIPILDAVSQEPLGVLAVMDTKPIAKPQLMESLLAIFSVRIATELARQQAATEQKELLAREQLARQSAEQANRTKDEFLAIVSHELRTPLNPIIGWTQMLSKGILNAEKSAFAIATIERNAKLQVQLIDDLLDISRILRGKLTLKEEPVDLSQVISMALDTVSQGAEKKSIHIETQVKPSVVLGDVGRLQQIVWNLLSNAVKFTPEGGQIKILLRRDEQDAILQVVDTGKGIDPEFIPFVFERFQQEDYSTTRHFGGLGLGLSIVRQLVEMHRGQISAFSKGENQGTTFTLRLPLVAVDETIAAAPSKALSGTDLSRSHILVVDDDVSSLEMATFVLETAGAQVTTAASGAEAIQRLSEGPVPDLMLSDIGMPEMDGYTLMKKIRQRTSEQGGEIRAIALTAYAKDIDQQQVIAAGFQHYLSKPVDIEQLVKLVSDLLKVTDA